MYIPDRAARMNDSVFQLELRFFTPCCLDCSSNFVSIIRMDALKERFVWGLAIEWIKTQNPVAFFRHIPDLARGWYRCPTTRVTEPLRLRQVSLAFSQALFSFLALSAFSLQRLVSFLKFLDR